ncbi:MAG: hypothetical protein R2764_15090 [Bacteroidales bacterium]
MNKILFTIVAFLFSVFHLSLSAQNKSAINEETLLICELPLIGMRACKNIMNAVSSNDIGNWLSTGKTLEQ